VVDLGGQPSGTSLGSQGPDQGFAFRLARSFVGRLRPGAGERIPDVVAGCVGVALKRAALFGRAPIAADLEVAFDLFGFLEDPPTGDRLVERRRLFAEASHHHHYSEVRRIVDLVPDGDLDRMLPPMQPTGHPEPARPGPRYKVIQKPAGGSGSQKGRALDSVIPIALFLVLNRIWGLGAGVAGATLWSIKVAVDRRRREESVGRFLPILVVYLVVRAIIGILTDSEAVYFGIGIGTKAAVGVALIATVVAGQPVLARYAPMLVPFSSETRAHPLYLKVMGRLTVFLGVYQILTSVWDIWLFNRTSTDGYVLIRFAVGWPAGTLATMVAFAYANRALRPIPDYPGIMDLMDGPSED